VIRTRVGYTGGTTPAPTYQSIGNHTEAVQVDFDPSKVSYEELLNVFFLFHNVCTPTWSIQYKNAVFAHSAEQQQLAQDKLTQQAAKRGGPAETEVLTAGTFYLAEDYHQKYALRQYKKMSSALTEIYPKSRDFIDSTAAARLNAFAHGYGSVELLEAEIDSYSLPPEAEQELRALVP
jgi:peptide-methionine (S)-S-oxide reductase